jgi:hypothetical protein
MRALQLILAAVAAAALAGTAWAQISPGPLTAAHQSLEGAAKCNSCHVFGLGQRALKCLDCHTEIARRVTANLGFHAQAYKASETQLDCARCHAEHNGRRFQITKLDRASFDHPRMTGFPLQGKHASVECQGCHKAELVRVRAAEIKVADRSKTFLGLPVDCAGCHLNDPHKGRLGIECASCHSQEAWKPAPLFDHSKTSYPLTGKHQQVNCSGCHRTAPGESVPTYWGLRYTSCDNCHKDPHQGAFADARFQGDCGNCHLTLDWKAVRSDNGFRHSQTKFPLLGKHTEVGCFKCHMNSDFSQPVAHALCADCHQDTHQGQFAARAAGSDCAACHNEDAFKPSLFTLDQHQQSKFPLQGKHNSVECVQCHKPAGPDAKYALGTAACVSCHKDPHGAEFASGPYNNNCESCHTQTVFHPSTFTLSEHQKSNFALTGAHLAIVCGDCHRPLTGAASDAARQYHFATQDCRACHMDPHRTKETCETCHNIDRWKTLRPFDHNQTTFELQGAHVQATCIGCHRPAETAQNTTPTADFYSTPSVCHECHEDIHGGQFMEEGAEEECASCHTLNSWNVASFDHDKTAFPLDGAHDMVRCAQCHTQNRDLNGRQVRLYRGAPRECSGCHSDGTVIAR